MFDAERAKATTLLAAAAAATISDERRHVYDEMARTIASAAQPKLGRQSETLRGQVSRFLDQIRTA